jgi:uncharacterized surface anchored protein
LFRERVSKSPEKGISQPIVLTTDESGKFAAPDLEPGKYSVRATKEGFDPIVSAVDRSTISSR